MLVRQLVLALIVMTATACIGLECRIVPGGTTPTQPPPEPTLDLAALVSTRIAHIAPGAKKPTTEPPPEPAVTLPSLPAGFPASTPAKLHDGPTIAQLAAILRPSLVQIRTRTSYGSGFIYDAAGLIVTNAHVVDCCGTIRVLVGPHSYTAEVVNTDAAADIAVISITGDHFQPVQFADDGAIAVGDEVVALGFPLDLGDDPTVTSGIVSSRRQLGNYAYFQHDASINPGSSGGPLIDFNGLVVGMNTSKHLDAEGVGFALSSGEIRQFLGIPLSPAPVPTVSPITPTLPIVQPMPTPLPRSTPIPTLTPTPDTTFIQVSAEQYRTCAITGAGDAVCWGADDAALPNAEYQHISVGRLTVCGVRTSGEIDCWNVPGSVPVSPPAGEFQQVSVGSDHSCAVGSGGAAYCWNHSDGKRSRPDRALSQVSSWGDRHCGIADDGGLVCWDDYSEWYGALPSGRFIHVSVGAYHACGIRSDDRAVCWTDKVMHCGITHDGSPGCWTGNDHGQSDAPDGRFQSITAGELHSCAVRTNGSVICWGYNKHGQADPPIGDFRSVSGHFLHTCGIRTDGSIECWGRDAYGQATPPD